MLCRLFNKKFAANICILILFLIVVLVLRIFDVTCIFYKLTGIPCPTCYMTRAFEALIKGNIQEYFRLNAMAIPVGVSFLCLVFCNNCRKHKHKFIVFSTIILTINYLYYVFRMLV